MKTLEEFLSTETPAKQLDESTTRGKASIIVIDRMPTKLEATIVHKSDGYGPNISIELKFDADKQRGNLVVSTDIIKGSFEDKRYAKAFISTMTNMYDAFDELETYLIMGRTKQAEKLLQKLGVTVDVAS